MLNVVDCDVAHNPADTFLTLAMIFGIIVSYIPQHLKIIKLKSSNGISPWFLLMGGLSATSNLFNVLILQAPYSCWENLLGLAQMLVQWGMFQIIFLLYYWNFPDESKVPNWDGLDSAQYTINDVPVSREWWLSVQVARVIRFWAGFMMLSLGWLVFWHGLPSSAGTGFAWFLGIVSAGLSMLQYLPQIYRTYQNRDPGAISLGAMIMQTPGSFIFCYTLAMSPGVNASTWLTYLIGGCLQGTLLILCIYYRYWEPRREYIVVIERTTGE